jgi:hypothetical protein
MLTDIRDWFGSVWARALGRPVQTVTKRTANGRAPLSHVIILDGTMSTLEEGMETNAGQTYRLLRDLGPAGHISLKYEPGVQWTGWRGARNVMAGVGINRQICRAYGFIASRYKPGDRIYLFGFSRGAYAVRSLAGLIDRIGLLKAEHATERMIRQAYRHYQTNPNTRAAAIFSRRYCHQGTKVQMVGVWDTVKSLGLRVPLIWRLVERFLGSPHSFHNHRLGPSILHGYHALALQETRRAFAPVLWDCPPGFEGDVEQVWFKGTHGDVGGHILDFKPARPLANISLVWMLSKAEGCGLPLPEGWRARIPQDINAPSVGTFRGWAKFFVLRRRRLIGFDRSEAIHPSAAPYPGLRVADVGPLVDWLGAEAVAKAAAAARDAAASAPKEKGGTDEELGPETRSGAHV